MDFKERSFYLVIPTFNRSALLLRAIESAVSAFENYLLTKRGTLCIIVVDDGSTDNTKETVLGFQLENQNIFIRYLFQQNQGAYAARNKAIDYLFAQCNRVASNCYLSFLDSDDILSPYFFTGFLSQETPSTVFIYEETLFNEDTPQFSSSNRAAQCLPSLKGTIEMIRRSRGVVNIIYPLACWQNVRFPPSVFYEDVSASVFACTGARRMVFLPIIGYGVYIGNNSLVRREVDDYYCSQRISSAALLWDLSSRLTGRVKCYYRSFFMGTALHFFIKLSEKGYIKMSGLNQALFTRKKVFLSGFGKPRSFVKSMIFVLLGRRLYFRLFSKK